MKVYVVVREDSMVIGVYSTKKAAEREVGKFVPVDQRSTNTKTIDVYIDEREVDKVYKNQEVPY